MIIIAAMTKDRVIGSNNKIPWNLPEDLKLFRQLTSGSTIIMGRKTFESIGRPLPNRNNIVVTRSDFTAPGIDICHSLPEAIKKAGSYQKDIFCIGGAELYKQCLPLATKMIISIVNGNYSGDTYFPAFDEEEWKLLSTEQHPGFESRVYEKRK